MDEIRKHLIAPLMDAFPDLLSGLVSAIISILGGDA